MTVTDMTPLTALRLQRFEESRPPTVSMTPWPRGNDRAPADLRPPIEKWATSDEHVATLLVTAPGFVQAALAAHDALRPGAAAGTYTAFLTLQQITESAEFPDGGLVHVAEQASMLVLYDVHPERATAEDVRFFQRILGERRRYAASCRQVIVSPASSTELAEFFGTPAAMILTGCALVTGTDR